VGNLVANSEIRLGAHSNVNAFWAELSACEHFVQIYEADDVFIDTLVGFVSGGLKEGNAAVVIATPVHRRELERRLTAMGLDVVAARARDQFICLDAEETLAKFMVDGWPDENRFAAVVSDVLERARRDGRQVRAFGEMVAVMWAKGYHGATVRLEHLWHHICQRESFALFCAYPRAGFTENASASIAQVCAAHSKVLGA
jgi:hypothetical protein